jgi:hypothetical protein
MVLREEFAGSQCLVFTLDQDGRNLAHEFVFSLPGREQQKVRALLQRVADYGLPLHDQQKCKVLHKCGNLVQLRASQVRLLGFVVRGVGVVLTNGFLKKQDPKVQRQIDRAIRLRDLWRAEQESR